MFRRSRCARVAAPRPASSRARSWRLGELPLLPGDFTRSHRGAPWPRNGALPPRRPRSRRRRRVRGRAYGPARPIPVRPRRAQDPGGRLPAGVARAAVLAAALIRDGRAGGSAGTGSGFATSQQTAVRREAGQLRLAADGLPHPVQEPQQRLVPGAHLGLGAPAHPRSRSSAAAKRRVSKSRPSSLAARLGAGPQEPRELALRQQHHLAELLAAHADQLGDLLADLLVGAAQRPPLARPASCSRSSVRALSRVVPLPRFLAALLGRRRVISSRRPATVRSRTTSVRVPGAAWSLRSAPAAGGRRAPRRRARSRPRPARRSCRRRSGRAAGTGRRRRARRSRRCWRPPKGPKAVRSAGAASSAPPPSAVAADRAPRRTRLAQHARVPRGRRVVRCRRARGPRSPRRSAGRCGPAGAGRRRRVSVLAGRARGRRRG